MEIFALFYKDHPKYPKNNFCQLVQIHMDQEICTHNFTLRNPSQDIDQVLYDFVITYTRDNIVKMKIFFKEPYYTQIVACSPCPALSWVLKISCLFTYFEKKIPVACLNI